MQKIMWLVLAAWMLAACGPSRVEMHATQTAVIATSDALKTQAAVRIPARAGGGVFGAKDT